MRLIQPRKAMTSSISWSLMPSVGISRPSRSSE
jgi:hypothetical protein